MADPAKAKVRDESDKLQGKIKKQWKNFATMSPEAYNDLMDYIDSQRKMYLKYCEDMAMPHPTTPGEKVAINNNTIAALLQSGRGMGIVKTYIQNRVDTDVVQPKK